MEKLYVHISLDSDGQYIAEASQNKYPVALYGLGKSPLLALADLEQVCVEAKEFCNGLPDFEFIVEAKQEKPFIIPSYMRANSHYAFA